MDIYCCNESDEECAIDEIDNDGNIKTKIVCPHGTVKSIDEKCLDECPSSKFSSSFAISLSTSSKICSEMKQENKCYKSLHQHAANLVCLDTPTNSTDKILDYCRSSKSPEDENYYEDEEQLLLAPLPELCPQISTSKFSFQECYHTGIDFQKRRQR